MQNVLKITGHEQFVKDEKGEMEYVILPYKDYEHIVELLEDYGLGQAIIAAENGKKYSKEDALRLLDE